MHPIASGDAVERAGFLSGVLGAKIGTAGALTVTVEHSDDGETFEAVTDKKLFIEKQTTDGAFTTDSLAADDIVNIDLDLIGLKDFIKITISGAAATGTMLAIALGDMYTQPV